MLILIRRPKRRNYSQNVGRLQKLTQIAIFVFSTIFFRAVFPFYIAHMFLFLVHLNAHASKLVFTHFFSLRYNVIYNADVFSAHTYLVHFCSCTYVQSSFNHHSDMVVSEKKSKEDNLKKTTRCETFNFLII
jgi:hypothetical protein